MAKQRRSDPLQVLIEVIVITIGIAFAYQLNSIREVKKTKEAFTGLNVNFILLDNMEKGKIVVKID